MTTLSGAEHEIVRRLATAVAGVSKPFACSGTFLPNKPVALRFKNGKRVGVRRLEDREDPRKALASLLERCRPATFGARDRTLQEPEIRNALQLRAVGGT